MAQETTTEQNQAEVRKPQLHVSALNMLSRCGEQFRRRYIEGEKQAPGIKLIVGTATDKTVTKNLVHKVRTQSLLGADAVKDTARDSLIETWNQGVWLAPDERGEDIKVLQGAAIDKAVRLSELHRTQLAPLLNPGVETNVQKSWVIELEDYPVDLAGAIDLVDMVGVAESEDGTPVAQEAIRDLKTTGKSPSASAAQDSEQLVMYSFAYKILEGRMPEYVALDFMVDNKKPVVKTLTAQVTEDQFEPLFRRVENAIQAMEKGVFVPARADDWWCGERFCGFHGSCPYVRRGVSALVQIDL